jgi:membrane peptidoglycan carboxypeptidase
MRKNNYLTEEEYQIALKQKLNILPPKIGINAPHFVMYVKDILVDLYGENLVNKGGLKVTTTLDLNIQEYSQKAVVEELKRINSLNVTNGSVLVTKPETGEILAMIGSKNYFDLEHDGQVNLTTALRQPGSSIKPINYALAIENGLSVNTILKDEPVTFNVIGTGLWSPKNYDGQFHGNVTLRNALANSYNIPAVLLLARNGIKNTADLGRKMGISTWNDESRFGLSLTLGSLETKMTDMAVAFGTFANQGVTVPLNPFLKIEDSQGKSLPIPKYSSTRSLKESTAFLISDILSDNTARARAFGYNSVLNISPRKAAVKTGTSNELKDNWTIGYTPDYLVATWVGNNDGSPMSKVASGITGASPIWSNVIKEIIKDHPPKNFDVPSNFIKVGICELTGELACENCPVKYEYFLKGTQPIKACNLTPTPSPTP